MWNQDGFKQLMEDDRYGRFRYGVATNSSADWGWIQHILASLKPSGRVGVVLDQGALFRGGAEGSIREGVLKDDLVECVVALPEKLFYNTGAPGCLIFLNKNKPETRKGKVLFIYAAGGFEKMSNMNRLRDKDIHQIIGAFDSCRDEAKYTKVVEQKVIEENDWNLSVTRYVDIFDEPEEVDIPKVWAELKELEKHREVANQKLASHMRELGFEG
jgi:type I restriction enzyme M protein